MLSRREQFFLELMKVPRMESKLRVLMFKIRFNTQVRYSFKLKEVMKRVTSLGNTTNQGTTTGKTTRN
ncbi:putative formin, FH2 domain-containing protein [Helianthus debilis subsp. tardiflorus]